MATPTIDDQADSQALAARLLGIIGASWMSQAAYVAAQLRIPDLLADGPKTSAELASASGGHAPSVHRLLRALTTLDICREREAGIFELTPMGALLRSDEPGTLRSWAVFWGGPDWPVWSHLLDSVKTGETGRQHLAGTKDFEHLAHDPDLAALFNQAMVELTWRVARAVARVYDFSGLGRIVDVGGGYGELLGTILQANPGARGVLFDMAHAREAGQRHLDRLGLADRCEIVTGSFFESVPGPADAILLKSIVHDWDDEHSRAILGNCRQALAAGGKLLIIERLMPERLDSSPAHQAIVRGDLNMMVGPGGRERTEAEFQALLGAAGLRLNRIIPTGSGLELLEAVAA
ncbi:MAG: methyltransferase [Anaerolineales bacterium]